MLFLLLHTNNLMAEAWSMARSKSGVGAFLVSSNSASEDLVTGKEYEEGKSNWPYLGHGMDFQLALSKTFSLGITGHEVTHNFKYENILEIDMIKYDIIGLEGSYWMGSFFLGAHLSSYKLEFKRIDDSRYAGRKVAPGLRQGWDGEIGLFMSLSSDAVKEITTNKEPEVDVVGNRIQLSYRFHFGKWAFTC